MRSLILVVAIAIGGCVTSEGFQDCMRDGSSDVPAGLIRSPSPDEDEFAFSSSITLDTRGVPHLQVRAAVGPSPGFDTLRIGWVDLQAREVIADKESEWHQGPQSLQSSWNPAGPTHIRAFVEYINASVGPRSTLIFVHDYRLGEDSCSVDAQTSLDAWRAVHLAIERGESHATVTLQTAKEATGILEIYDSGGAVNEQIAVRLDASESRSFDVAAPDGVSLEAVFSPAPETGLITSWQVG